VSALADVGAHQYLSGPTAAALRFRGAPSLVGAVAVEVSGAHQYLSGSTAARALPRRFFARESGRRRGLGCAPIPVRFHRGGVRFRGASALVSAVVVEASGAHQYLSGFIAAVRVVAALPRS
jgi:hypothetical protein